MCLANATDAVSVQVATVSFTSVVLAAHRPQCPLYFKPYFNVKSVVVCLCAIQVLYRIRQSHCISCIACVLWNASKRQSLCFCIDTINTSVPVFFCGFKAYCEASFDFRLSADIVLLDLDTEPACKCRPNSSFERFCLHYRWLTWFAWRCVSLIRSIRQKLWLGIYHNSNFSLCYFFPSFSYLFNPPGKTHAAFLIIVWTFFFLGNVCIPSRMAEAVSELESGWRLKMVWWTAAFCWPSCFAQSLGSFSGKYAGRKAKRVRSRNGWKDRASPSTGTCLKVSGWDVLHLVWDCPSVDSLVKYCPPLFLWWFSPPPPLPSSTKFKVYFL